MSAYERDEYGKRYRPRRPKSIRKRCVHCRRLRLAKFIEWHPGIEEWQCSNLASCDAAMEPQS